MFLLSRSLEIDTASVASHNNKKVSNMPSTIFVFFAAERKFFRISRISGKTYFIEKHYFPSFFVFERRKLPPTSIASREKTTSKWNFHCRRRWGARLNVLWFNDAAQECLRASSSTCLCAPAQSSLLQDTSAHKNWNVLCSMKHSQKHITSHASQY